MFIEAAPFLQLCLTSVRSVVVLPLETALGGSLCSAISAHRHRGENCLPFHLHALPNRTHTTRLSVLRRVAMDVMDNLVVRLTCGCTQ